MVLRCYRNFKKPILNNFKFLLLQLASNNLIITTEVVIAAALPQEVKTTKKEEVIINTMEAQEDIQIRISKDIDRGTTVTKCHHFHKLLMLTINNIKTFDDIKATVFDVKYSYYYSHIRTFIL